MTRGDLAVSLQDVRGDIRADALDVDAGAEVELQLVAVAEDEQELAVDVQNAEKYETFLPVTPCTFTMNTRLFVNTTWSRMVWKHCTASSPGAKRSAISQRIWAREPPFRFG